MTRSLFDTTLAAAATCAQNVPALRDFIPWPKDMPFANRTPRAIPALGEMRQHPGAATALTQPLQDALLAMADHVQWNLTYTEEEVGADFLRRFGWFELAGPRDGYFQTDITRMTVGYWGPNLYYPWHLHAPEELYFVVSGEATFEVEGHEPKLLRAGDTMFHASNQPHALTTHNSGILTFVLWRGAGLADPPRMDG